MLSRVLASFVLATCASACGGTESTDTDGGEAGGSGTGGGSGETSSGSGSSGSGTSTSSSSSDTGGTTGEETAEGGLPPSTPLDQRIGVVDVPVPGGVEEGVENWRIWGRGDLNVAPVFTAPLADCGTLVCYTSGAGSPSAHVVHLDAADQLVTIHDVGVGVECRGLAAEPDGAFGVLLWDDGADTIRIDRFDATGAPSWSRPLTNPDNNPTDFGLGDSRLEFGGSRYGAYYHVHSDSGHEGDTLKWADAGSGTEDTEWEWGCSHSMSNVLRYHEAAGFLSACVTDCYPGTDGSDFENVAIGGIYVDLDTKVLDVDAGCNGDVAAELGSAAIAPTGWKLVFNAHRNPAGFGQGSYDPDSMNQDLGFAPVSGDRQAGAVVWLTDTPTIDETDSTIVAWHPSGDPAEQYLVAWAEADANDAPTAYKLARIDAAAAILEGPLDVGATIQWGRRDDPFREAKNGDTVWAWFDAPGSTTLHVGRIVSGGSCG